VGATTALRGGADMTKLGASPEVEGGRGGGGERQAVSTGAVGASIAGRQWAKLEGTGCRRGVVWWIGIRDW
jgi:hypothetical protein